MPLSPEANAQSYKSWKCWLFCAPSSVGKKEPRFTGSCCSLTVSQCGEPFSKVGRPTLTVTDFWIPYLRLSHCSVCRSGSKESQVRVIQPTYCQEKLSQNSEVLQRSKSTHGKCGTRQLSSWASWHFPKAPGRKRGCEKVKSPPIPHCQKESAAMLAFFLRTPFWKQHTEVHMAANVGPKGTIRAVSWTW